MYCCRCHQHRVTTWRTERGTGRRRSRSRRRTACAPRTCTRVCGRTTTSPVSMSASRPSAASLCRWVDETLVNLALLLVPTAAVQQTSMVQGTGLLDRGPVPAPGHALRRARPRCRLLAHPRWVCTGGTRLVNLALQLVRYMIHNRAPIDLYGTGYRSVRPRPCNICGEFVQMGQDFR